MGMDTGTEMTMAINMIFMNSMAFFMIPKSQLKNPKRAKVKYPTSID